MRIVLGEALRIAKDSEIRVKELRYLRDAVAFVTYAVGEAPEEPERTVDEVTKEINELSAKARYLRQLVANENLKQVTEFELDGDRITLAEALLLLSQMMAGREYIKTLANARPKVRKTGYNGIVEYTEVTFDIDKMKDSLKTIERDIQKLRIAIDKVNVTTELEVPDEVVE